MKVKRINIVENPLSISFAINIEGGSSYQTYNSTTAKYIPDHSITPAVLVPFLSVQLGNLQNPTPAQDRSDSIINMKWFDVSGGNRLQIFSDDNYTINADNSLTVKKNILVSNPVTIQGEGQYFDYRTGNTLKFSDKKTLTSTAVAEDPVILDVDKPSLVIFDPLSGGDGLIPINAKVLYSGIEAQVGKRVFMWTIDGREITDDDLFMKSISDETIVIDAKYIDGQKTITCIADYNALGVSAIDVNKLSSYTLRKDITISRQYSDYDYDFFVKGSEQVSKAVSSIKAEAYVNKSNEILSSPENFFNMEWLIRRNVFGAEWRKYGYGSNIEIPKAEYDNGAQLAFDITQKDPLKALAINNTEYYINGLVATL